MEGKRPGKKGEKEKNRQETMRVIKVVTLRRGDAVNRTMEMVREREERGLRREREEKKI